MTDQERDVLREIVFARNQRHAAHDEGLPSGTSGHNFRREANAARLASDRAHRGAGLTWFHVARTSFWAAMSETRNDKLRGALVWLAADIIAWIECLDRRMQEEPGLEPKTE